MEIFVTASNGIYSIGKNGTAHLLLPVSDNLITPPAAGPDYVIYGINDTLYKLNTNTKGMDWTITLDDGAFWAPAVIDGSILYVGALDGMMHAYSVNGGQIWQARTRNWVMGTPLVSEGRVYFGSNDGGVYAVDSGSGNTRWVAQTQMAVQTMPEKGTMGGRNVIFAGAGDNSAYAIDIGNGEIVWKGSATGAVGSPLFYENKVIFGSQDRNVYAYSTERACSILSPREANVLSLKEVVVSGRFVSAAGGATVWVSVNGQPWEEANVSGAAWEKYVKPRGEFKPGLNIISCKVSDNGGEENGGAFTSIAVNHDPNIPLSTLMVTVSPTITENVPFIIYVNDGDDGSPVDRFELTVDGKTLTGNKNLTLGLGAGTHGVLVKKEGFNDAEVSISVSSASINPAYPAVGGVLILIIVWRAWSSFRTGRVKKK
jgi:outer membrane protein assembly factor BamB